MRIHWGLGIVMLLLLGDFSAGGGDKIKTVGRALLAENKDAVVSVKVSGFVALELNGKLEKEEFNSEVTGTVCSPSGLTAICLLSATMDKALLSDPTQPKPKVVFSTFELVFGDGRKLPAKIALKDEALGVVFVAPKEKQTKLKYVQMEKKKVPELLDRLYVLSRLGATLDRQPEIATGRIKASLKKGHAAFVSDIVDLDGGGAVFDETGHPIGLGVLRKNGDSPSASLRLLVLPAEALPIAKLEETIKLWDKTEK